MTSAIHTYVHVCSQDSIAALKQKMSANAKESEEKIKTIKEVRTEYVMMISV